MKTLNVIEISKILFDMEKPYSPEKPEGASEKLDNLTEKFHTLGYNRALLDVITKLNELSH